MRQSVAFYGKTPVIEAERFTPGWELSPANCSLRGLGAASLARGLGLSYDLAPQLGETETTEFDILGRDLARVYQMLC